MKKLGVERGCDGRRVVVVPLKSRCGFGKTWRAARAAWTTRASPSLDASRSHDINNSVI